METKKKKKLKVKPHIIYIMIFVVSYNKIYSFTTARMITPGREINVPRVRCTCLKSSFCISMNNIKTSMRVSIDETWTQKWKPFPNNGLKLYSNEDNTYYYYYHNRTCKYHIIMISNCCARANKLPWKLLDYSSTMNNCIRNKTI